MYMKRRSILLIIREMKIKITMSYNFTFMRMAKIKETKTPNFERMESH